MSQRLLEFLKSEHPDVLESYKAKTDPMYFQVGKTYQPMKSGFGGSGRRYKNLILTGISERDYELKERVAAGGSHVGAYLVSKTEAYIKLSKPLH
jgi:hypothetical protein